MAQLHGDVFDAAGNQTTCDRDGHGPGAYRRDSSARARSHRVAQRPVDLGHSGDGLGLEARVINAATDAVTRNLPLAEIGGGSYTATWDGRDNFGNFAGANNYRIEVYAPGGTVRYYPTRTITVNAAVFAISASPDPFTPDGTNFTTITVLADPMQTGWTARISDTAGNTTGPLPLTEVGSEGTYTTNWDGTINGAVPDDGVMVIRVYDAAGNLFPATGTVTIDSTPPPVGPEPASNFTATATDTGIRLNWTHSPSEDVAGYRLYWNSGSGEIDYSRPYATILYPIEHLHGHDLPAAGTYRFGLRAVDRDGVEELNTTVTAAILVEAFSVTVAVGAGPFDRGQDIEITGSVEFGAAAPVADVPVQVNIRSATSRTFTVYTDAQGDFRYTFQPLAGEAGSYTVEAVVVRTGSRRSAMTSFRILGLWLQPASLTLQISMNATQTRGAHGPQHRRHRPQWPAVHGRGPRSRRSADRLGDGSGAAGAACARAPGHGARGAHASGGRRRPPRRRRCGCAVTVRRGLDRDGGGHGDAQGCRGAARDRAAAAQGRREARRVRHAGAHRDQCRLCADRRGGAARCASRRPTPWIQVLSGELGSLEPQQAKEVQILVSPPAESRSGCTWCSSTWPTTARLGARRSRSRSWPPRRASSPCRCTTTPAPWCPRPR